MIIYNYNSFLNEAKEVVLDISDKLQKVLKSMKDPIAEAILKVSVHGDTPGVYDIAYLDYFDEKDKNDKISFLPANKISPDLVGDPFKAKGRQEMSVGRIVNKLFPEKFTQPQIEAFVNDFKASLKKFFINLQLVQGEEIRYWYLETRYASRAGDINSSCMRGQKAQTFFDIYCNNPEKCKLLILKNDDNLLMGRALVWFEMRKPTGRVYMDRIYTINDADKKLYIDHAIANNWLYKNKQVMHDASYIDNGKLVYSSVAIQLKPVEYKQYPSLDTLSYYTPSTGRLGSNAGNYVPGHPRYQLNSTTGGAAKIDR
jgi:hypothetical protein